MISSLRLPMALVLCVSLLSIAQARSTAWLIVPGSSIGPVSIGMPWSDANRLLGGNYSADASPRGDYRFYTYEKAGIVLHVDRNGRVHKIQISSSRYATKSGFRVGSKLDTGASVYGQPGSGFSEVPENFEPNYRYWPFGMAVRVDNDERVQIIFLSKPR